MHAARLSIEHTDETIHPMHAFVCESPHVDREMLLEATVEDERRTILFYVEGDREPYEASLEGRRDLLEYDVAPDPDGNGFYLYVRVRHRPQDVELLQAFDLETVVVVPPVEFRSDRTMRLTAVGPADALRAIVDDLPAGTSVEVVRVGDYTGAVGVSLTDRQREAITVARELGYYEVPRERSIEAVADELGCAVSTASDLLRRAEAGLVDDVLGP